MNSVAEQVLLGIAVNYFSEFSFPVVKNFFTHACSLKPSLADQLQNVRSTQDIERVLQEAAGAINVAAGAGSITVDRTFLSAVQSIRFDHQQGTVTFNGAILDAKRINLGGNEVGVGMSHFTNSVARTHAGASIDAERGAGITITGNAKIEMT